MCFVAMKNNKILGVFSGDKPQKGSELEKQADQIKNISFEMFLKFGKKQIKPGLKHTDFGKYNNWEG